MKKYILLFLFTLLSLKTEIKVSAQETHKKTFPFEITSVVSTNDGLLIQGWGMASATHHYSSTQTHSYELKLQGKTHSLSFTSSPTYNSQTNTMKVYNVRKCGANEYYQRGGICYYNYDYVGFEFYVPYSRLKVNENYQTSLIVHSNVLGFSQTTPLFYPILTPIREKKDTIVYQVTSNLYETQLKIAENAVFDRVSPSKSGEIRKTSSICSATYGYSRFFDEGSHYSKVYDRYPNESTTYYKVKTSYETHCVDGRNVIQEGSAYDSWIASNWVDFKGEGMTISVTDTNRPPVIEILNHPTIKDDESHLFNFKNYIKATDPEDGILTNKVIVKNQVNLSTPGEYDLLLEVKDKQGLTATNKLHVTVIEGNTAPLIYAENITLYQYDKFNPLEHVQAIDKEDGNITHKVTYKSNVNTKILGDYYVTYYVSDSKNKIAEKSIVVSVIRNPNEKIRYISHHDDLVFYKENIPLNWKETINYLLDQIEHPKVFAKRYIE